MPRIDPLQLLNCLHVLLTPTGGMKSENEVARISSLMEKFSKKLVSKCVYLLILKNSEPALLSRFMTLGGWNLIYHWLIQAIEAKNYPFLIELLEVILVCPVDIDRMKSNPMPRVVKSLSKDLNIDPKARDIASEIVKDWLVIVKSTPSATQPAARPAVTVPPMDPSQKQNEESESAGEVHPNEVHRASSENSAAGEEEEDESYTKSTSPSSSSAESDDSDVFVPYQKSQPKKKKLSPKKGKSLVKKSAPVPEEKRQLKSKLITSPGAQGERSGPIKLKIQVSSTESKSSRKSSDEKTIEEKLKEKRKLKDDKEKEKFARFKQVREKKEKRDKHEPDTKSRENKHFDEKLKGELSKLIPKSLEKLGRIPKLNKDKEKEKEKENGTAVSSDKRKDEKKPPIKSEEKKPDRTKEGEKSREKEAVKRDRDGKKVAPVPPPPPKKPVSISVEKRTAGEVKPKTVKAYNSKFRLTGLEQEVVPKPAARKPGSVSSSSPNSVSAGYEKSAVKRSPTKDVENEPIEKRLKSPEEEKLSPAAHRNKKPFLQESDSFMNAMDIALITQKEQLRKRKKPPPKSESEEKNESPTTPGRKNSDVSSPIIAKTEPAIKTEPVAEAKPAFKFYKDTLETSIEENADTIEAKEEPKEDVDIKAKAEPVDEDDKPKVNHLVDATNDPSKPRSAVGLKSSLSLFRTKKVPKKSVTWRADDELEAVQFFEVDATERTNVVRNFWEMQMMERTKERDMMMVRKSGDNDKMVVQTKWKPLIPIDLTPPTTARGANSQEKNIQYARERIVPPSLYYNKSMVPDTPAEPDLEIHPVTVPPIIPLDDISGTSADSVNDFSNFKWPEPKQFAPDNVDVNAMKAFLPGMPPPIFPPFADGTFPPPFAQPFFPGGAVPPLPVPGTWNATSTDSNQPNATTAVPWVPPGVVPPPGMIGPPPFGMMAPFPPIPGAAFPPAMFPMNNAVNNTAESTTTSSGTENQYSNSNYSTSGNNKDSSAGGGGGGSGGNSNGGSGSKKWTNDDRYYNKKDNWRNNYNDRRSDKRGSGSWRGSGANSRLCRFYQKKGFCSVSGCRFYHPDKN